MKIEQKMVNKKIKEISYDGIRRNEWLVHTTYNDGLEYVIMDCGTHPTIYIGIPKEHKLYMKDEEWLDDHWLVCHGGFTYSANYIHSENGTYSNDKWWIGWDYAHATDYMPLGAFSESGRKWKIEDLMYEVQGVLDQIRAKF